MFSMLGPGGAEGKSVLDLYAGTGALGLEALSRGAERAEFVEVDFRRRREISEAARELGYAERVQVRGGGAEQVTRGLSGRFDIVFIDPPYGEDPFRTLFENLASAGALKEDAVVFAEHATRTPLEEAYAGVGRTAEHRYGDTTVSVYRPVPGGDTGPG